MIPPDAPISPRHSRTRLFRLASPPHRPNDPSFRPFLIHVRTRNPNASHHRANHLSVILDARALVRLQSDHINRTLVPAFYRYLQAQDPAAQVAGQDEFKAAVDTLVGLFERADKEVGGTGLWKEGGELGWADVMVGPCESRFESSTMSSWLDCQLTDDVDFRVCAIEFVRDFQGNQRSQSLSRIRDAGRGQVQCMVEPFVGAPRVQEYLQ